MVQLRMDVVTVCVLDYQFYVVTERSPKMEAARFDHGRGELPIDWILSFIRSFGHVLGLFHI